MCAERGVWAAWGGESRMSRRWPTRRGLQPRWNCSTTRLIESVGMQSIVIGCLGCALTLLACRGEQEIVSNGACAMRTTMPSAELRQFVEQLREESDAVVAEPEADEYWEKFRTDPDPAQLAAYRQTVDQEMGRPVPDDVSVVEVNAGGVPAEWVRAPGSGPDRRLLYLHGGSWVAGSPTSHREWAGRVSRASGCSVLLIDYRLAPENPFPAGVKDALSALRWMRDNGPEGATAAAATYVAGDSVGGNLTLSLLLMARDAGLPLPNAVVTISAATDLAATSESFTTRAEKDPLLRFDARGARQAAQKYLGDAKLEDPLASPLYADLSGLPPLLMQVGDYEIFLDDTTRFADKARAAGVDVTCEIEPEAPHIYQILAPELPETEEALERIGAFLRKHR